MEVDYLSIGKRIKSVREKKKITQLELAEQTGLSRSYIGQVETGTRNASLDTIIAIANCLKISIEEILKDSVDFSSKEVSLSEAETILQDCTPGEERILTKNLKNLRETIRPFNIK